MALKVTSTGPLPPVMENVVLKRVAWPIALAAMTPPVLSTAADADWLSEERLPEHVPGQTSPLRRPGLFRQDWN